MLFYLVLTKDPGKDEKKRSENAKWLAQGNRDSKEKGKYSSEAPKPRPFLLSWCKSKVRELQITPKAAN